jgi:hypothetical protein
VLDHLGHGGFISQCGLYNGDFVRAHYMGWWLVGQGCGHGQIYVLFISRFPDLTVAKLRLTGCAPRLPPDAKVDKLFA